MCRWMVTTDNSGAPDASRQSGEVGNSTAVDTSEVVKAHDRTIFLYRHVEVCVLEGRPNMS